MYIQLPTFCPCCTTPFPASHPSSEAPPSNWRHPFNLDFPPLFEDAPPVVRYCEDCRKHPGASGYLKQGFLFEDYLAHCEDGEYVRLLRERFAGVRRGVGKVAEKGEREGEKGELGKKEKKAEKVRKIQETNMSEFWRDLEGCSGRGRRF